MTWKILGIDMIRDGGSLWIETDNGNFFLNRSIDSKNRGTCGEIYLRDKLNDKTNEVIHLSDVKNSLIEALADHIYRRLVKEFENRTDKNMSWDEVRRNSK